MGAPEDDEITAPETLLEAPAELLQHPAERLQEPEQEAQQAELVVIHSPDTLAVRDPEAAARAAQRSEQPISGSTKRNYAREWKAWLTWCRENAQCPKPADERAVLHWLSKLADEGAAVATLQVKYYAIRAAHRAFDDPLPVMQKVARLFKHLKREEAGKRAKPWRGKDALLDDVLQKLAEDKDRSAIATRNRAMLVVGFSAALRRSELVALTVEDVTYDEKGMYLFIRSGKTDQEGKGETVPVALEPDASKVCPIAALKNWLKRAHIETGPIFRRIYRHDGKDYVGPDALCDKMVAEVVKEFVEKQGLDPKLFAGHSLRSGFVTTAKLKGFMNEEITPVTRHKRLESLNAYDHRAPQQKPAIRIFGPRRMRK